MQTDLLLTGIGQLATPPAAGARHGAAMRDLAVINDAAIAITGGKVSWVGPAATWSGETDRVIDLDRRAVIPGLVDPHTHIVWAGDRYDDFVARSEGVGYEQILKRGGGIRSTVRATAAASVSELVSLALPRAAALISSGATTIEIKSGYGFTSEAELRSLEAIAAVARGTRATISPTLLIHIPPDDPAARAEYIEMVCHQLMPEVVERKLATAVDVFIEKEAWQTAEADQIFAAARNVGLAIKAHVDQFHPIGGLELAVRYGALSVDHLEASGEAQIKALAASDTIGTILPGVTLHLGIEAAPGRVMIDAGCAVAIGTDCNPGSSPLFSIQQAAALGCCLNGLTPAEALTAVTANAAAALGFSDRGAIVPGLRADLAVLDDSDWRCIAWKLGTSPIARLFNEGIEVTA